MTTSTRTCVGLVVHPTRDIDEEMDALREWARKSSSPVIQIDEQEREVAERGEVEDCALLVTLGGDGTALRGIRAAGAAGCPVLGVACGSLGVLTAVGADALPRALDRFTAGEWVVRGIPALEVRSDDSELMTAVNDVALIRAGEGQVTAGARVDGVLYGRVVGDGFVVSTPVGSSAYTLAAGGPLLAPGASAFVFTPLSSHGGNVPPLVIGSESVLEVEVDLGHGGARLETDGESGEPPRRSLEVSFRPDTATLVTFDDAEPLLTGLRRRKIVMDSPRVLAREERERKDGSEAD